MTAVETDAENELRALRTLQDLCERGLLLLTTPVSVATLARKLSARIDDWDEDVGQLGGWLIEQNCVVDLLADDDELAGAIVAARAAVATTPLENRTTTDAKGSTEQQGKGGSKAPPRQAFRWDEDKTSIEVLSDDYVVALEAVGAWWRRVHEVAATDPERCDAILCTLGDESVCAQGLIDPKRAIERYAGGTNLPPDAKLTNWTIVCYLPPSLGEDADATVLDQDTAFALLESALATVGREARLPAYFWDAEYAGKVERIG